MQIIFSRSHHPYHYLIAIFQRCKWAHVGIIDDGTVLEASGKYRQVVRTPLNKFKARSIETITRNIPGDIQQARLLVGRPYDMWAIRGMVLGINLEEPWALHCSEYVSLVSGIFDEQHCWRIKPKDLLNLKEIA